MSTQAPDKEKLKVLQAAIERIDKTYGKITIMRMGEEAVEPVEAIETGSISLDIALGINGLPKGRVIEIYDLNHPVKQHWQYMLLQTFRKMVALLHI